MNPATEIDIECRPERSTSITSLSDLKVSQMYETSSMQRLNLFRARPTKELFMELRASEKTLAILELDITMVNEIFGRLEEVERASVLQDVSFGALEKLSPLLTEEENLVWRSTASYDRNTVGSIMAPAVHSTITSTRKLRDLSTLGPTAWRGGMSMLFVEDEEGKYVGAIDLMDAFSYLAQDATRADAPLSELNMLAVPTLTAKDALVEVATLLEAHRSLHMLPVLDREGYLVGRITAEALLRHQLLEERANAQAQHLSPLGTSYSKSSLAKLVRKRVPWLLGLLAVNLGSAAVIAENEAAIEKRVILAAFIPLLMAAGGNTGAQTSSLIISALSSRDIEVADWWTVMRREFIGSLVLGGILALCGWLLGYFLADMDANIGFIVGLSMFAIVVSANFLGSSLPFLATTLKQNPSVVCSPILTTVVDVAGVLVYFALALLFID